MAQSPTFNWVSDALEEHTSMNRLAARGTLRLALKKSGLEVDLVNPPEMELVLKQILPKELRSRGVTDAETLCEELLKGLQDGNIALAEATQQSPEDIFRRVFGDDP